jgi:hydroxyethylthiazole kinase-like uncharacterized protein yjeF
MRLIDRKAIDDYGISEITLMENAGSAVANVVTSLSICTDNIKICVLCGKGNNGGDGLVASRNLKSRGYNCDTYLLASPNDLNETPRFELSLLKDRPKTVKHPGDLPELKKYAIIVDAIFGTGFTGTHIKEPYRSLIKSVNAERSFVLSVDIPSGLNGTTGRVEDVAIFSDRTLTLGLPKRGFYKNCGPRHCGEITIQNIGFPNALLRGRIPGPFSN